MTIGASKPVRIWTICSEETYHALLQQGELVAELGRIDPDYAAAYCWLTEQLNTRLGTSVVTPWWGWHSWGGKRCGRPDLRSTAHMPRGAKSTLLELKLAASEVLLSQFEMWIRALNDDRVPESEADDSVYCVEERRIVYPQFPQGREPTNEERRASWERMFDLDFGCDQWWGPREERWIQACYPLLRLADVVSVQRFVAR
jgi:hypothetical protein